MALFKFAIVISLAFAAAVWLGKRSEVECRWQFGPADCRDWHMNWR